MNNDNLENHLVLLTSAIIQAKNSELTLINDDGDYRLCFKDHVEVSEVAGLLLKDIRDTARYLPSQEANDCEEAELVEKDCRH